MGLALFEARRWVGRNGRVRGVVRAGMGENADLVTQLDALERGVAFAHLPCGDVLRVVGPDHREALHRVVSQDIRGMREGDGRLALLLAPKGQFQAIMAVFAAEDGAYLLCPPGKGGAVASSLGKYLRFSHSRIEPLAHDAGFCLLGAGWRTAAGRLVAHVDRLAAGGVSGARGEAGPIWFGQTLLGLPGAIAVSRDAADTARLSARFVETGAIEVGTAAIELERIRVGWPTWGAELTETVLPPEAGLEKLAISYTKGCYVGQETIARLATYGHPNRALVGLRQRSNETSSPALPLSLSAPTEEKPRGILTSWGFHPGLGGVGLGLVRRELAGPGTRLAGGSREFDVTPIPLW
ncbi:MAG TPA: hypothetical protein VLW17_03550 [Thermoanaerobaculaceae bacterium]|nr:hypothetical protein [Thermoanaerobaculaceae bacterium]